MTMTSGPTRESTGFHPRGRAAQTADVTGSYRNAKKLHADQAVRVGSLRSEIAGLTSRLQQRNSSKDANTLQSLISRTEGRLERAEADLAAAANDYRVAHVELLMTPGPQRHYIDSIGKQQTLANLSRDSNEIAVLEAMRTTLALILSLAAARADTTTLEACSSLEDLKTQAARADTGAYRAPDGSIHEVKSLGAGVVGIDSSPLGQLPYDYSPGMPFASGHLMLNNAIRLGKQVDPGTPTGYSAARSIIL